MMFWTSPRYSIVATSGSGGTMPKKADSVASKGSTLYFSASAQNSSLSSATFSG